MNYLLLFITDAEIGLMYVGLGILSLIVWFALVRWAVRSNDIVHHQKAIIWFLILQCKKQGATDEEIKNIKDHFGIQ